MTDHLDTFTAVCHDVSTAKEKHIQSVLTSVLTFASPPTCCAIRRAVDFSVSGWLTVLPLAQYHFDLSPRQFRDTLSLHYN